MIEIPIEQLSEETLKNVIDEFILREGTDYGALDATMERKRKDIMDQLKNGKARLVYDEESESVTFIA